MPKKHTDPNVIARHKEYETIWNGEPFFEALCGNASLADTIRTHFTPQWNGMSVSEIIADMIRLGTNLDGVNHKLVARLKQLSQDGHVICLATDQVDFRYQYLRENFTELFRLFGYLFASCELNAVKAQPHFFESVLDTIGAPPENCIFIDDREANVECARSQGISAIRYAMDRHEAFERWLSQEV